MAGTRFSHAAGATETIPAISQTDGSSSSYTTTTPGDHLNIGTDGTNSINLRDGSAATITTGSANGVNGNITLDGGILLGRNSNQSFPGFLTIDAAGDFSSAAGLKANTNSLATITASSISFADSVSASYGANLTFNGNMSVTTTGLGLSSTLGSGMMINGDLNIQSGATGMNVGGGGAGYVTVNGESFIHSTGGMGISVFQDNTAMFNGFAHIISDTSYGVYVQGSANQPEGLASFTDVLVQSASDGILLLFNGSAVEVSGTAEIESGEVGVYSYSGRADFNNLKITSQEAGIFSDNNNSATASSTVTVRGTVDITASEDAGALAYRGGAISLNNGMVRGTGDDVHGLYALQNGQISVNGQLAVTTDGDNAYGMYAMTDGAIANTGNATVATTGNGSYGVYASDNGQISNSGTLTVSTSGNNTYAIYADDGGTVATTGTTHALTSGDGAVGVYVAADGIVTSGGLLAIQTSGNAAHGLYLDTGGTFTSTNQLQITTTGNAAHGILLDQGNAVDVGGTVAIRTSGAQSHGAFADNASSITLRGGNIAVGDGSYALYGDNGSTLNLATGRYVITGDVFADNNSQIDANFASGSSFTGAASMGDAASTVNFTMNNSLWQLTDVSELTSLTAGSGSLINLTGKAFNSATGGFTGAGWIPFGNVLTVATLGGSGSTFLMRTDIVGEQATSMTITDASSGSHKLYVHNDGSAQTTGNEQVDLVYDGAASRAADFSLTHVVELGGWAYDLEERIDPVTGETIWYLKGGIPEPAASSTGSNMTNIFRASRYLSIAETQTLMQRMGDLRAGADSNEVWVRTYGGRINVEEGTYARDFSLSYGGVQVGADRKLALTPFASRWGDLYLGAMFSYTYGDLDFRQSGDGSVDSKTLGAYATVVGDNGFYTDLVLKGMWLNNDLNGRDSAGERVSGETDRFGVGASLEIGKRIEVAEINQGTVYVEPQAQISWNWYGGDTMKASNGLHMKLDDYQEGIARFGLQAGLRGTSQRVGTYDVYGKVSYNTSFGDDMTILINDTSRIREKVSDRWVSAGAGLAFNIAQNHNVYVEYEYAKGRRFEQPWAVTAGWRMTF